MTIVATHYSYDTGVNYAEIISDDGDLLNTHEYSETYYGTTFNALVVDEDGNIYVAGKWQDKVLAMDKNCNELAEEDAPYIVSTAIDPDGYIWTSEISNETNNAIFKKRNPLTLAILDTCDGLGIASAYQGLIFDSDGYLYTVDWSSDEIEKWDVVGKTRVGHRALANHTEDYPIMSELRIRDDTIYLMQWASNDYGDYWTCPTDLSADFEAHELVEFDDDPETDTGYWAVNIVQLSTTGWIVMGVINAEVNVLRYDNDFTEIWRYQIDAVPPDELANSLCVGWYESAAYDYPIYPVIFPLET